MVQKYQNEISPIVYYGKKLKTSGKLLKIPDSQRGYESHHPHLLATLFSSGSKNMQNKVQNNVVLSNIAMQNKCLENMVAVKKLNANYIQDYNLVSGNN